MRERKREKEEGEKKMRERNEGRETKKIDPF